MRDDVTPQGVCGDLLEGRARALIVRAPTFSRSMAATHASTSSATSTPARRYARTASCSTPRQAASALALVS